MELRERILELYIHHWREYAKAPESVYRFCTDLEISEKDFFQIFSSFDAVDDAYWKKQIDDVIWAVSSRVEFDNFNARQKMLTFNFAYLEKSLEIRSLFLLRFSKLNPTCRPSWLKGYESSFHAFAQLLLNQGMQSGEIASRSTLSRAYPSALYLAFRSAIQYQLKDTSAHFEKTDVFVEKTFTLAFDLMATQAIDSAFDLAKFLLPKIARP